MGKRKGEDVSAPDTDQKKRRQSLVKSDVANPVGSDGLSHCFRQLKTRMHLSLAPAYSSSPIEGIQQQHLDPMLFQHEPKLGGVVISYSNVKLLKRKGTSELLGKIINESPFSFFWVYCEILVWSPQPGDVVEGWVSAQSPGHLALLIHDTFNASIKRTEIPENWEFIAQKDDEDGSKSLGYWQDSEGNHIDGKLQFTVRRSLHGGRTVLVLGSLLTADDVQPPRFEKSKSHYKQEENAYTRPVTTEAVKGKKITFDN